MNRREARQAKKRLEALGLIITGTRIYRHGQRENRGGDVSIDVVDPRSGISAVYNRIEQVAEREETRAFELATSL